MSVSICLKFQYCDSTILEKICPALFDVLLVLIHLDQIISSLTSRWTDYMGSRCRRGPKRTWTKLVCFGTALTPYSVQVKEGCWRQKVWWLDWLCELYPCAPTAADPLLFHRATFFSGLKVFPHKPTTRALRSNSVTWEKLFPELSFSCLESESTFCFCLRAMVSMEMGAFSDTPHTRVF